jgi:hypothetical protein
MNVSLTPELERLIHKKVEKRFDRPANLGLVRSQKLAQVDFVHRIISGPGGPDGSFWRPPPVGRIPADTAVGAQISALKAPPQDSNLQPAD